MENRYNPDRITLLFSSNLQQIHFDKYQTETKSLFKACMCKQNTCNAVIL
jgi:hypothetical protein